LRRKGQDAFDLQGATADAIQQENTNLATLAASAGLFMETVTLCIGNTLEAQVLVDQTASQQIRGETISQIRGALGRQ